MLEHLDRRATYAAGTAVVFVVLAPTPGKLEKMVERAGGGTETEPTSLRHHDTLRLL
jgi:hypothetical protein